MYLLHFLNNVLIQFQSIVCLNVSISSITFETPLNKLIVVVSAAFKTKDSNIWPRTKGHNIISKEKDVLYNASQGYQLCYVISVMMIILQYYRQAPKSLLGSCFYSTATNRLVWPNILALTLTFFK